MSGDSFFWTFFGSVWLLVGLMAALASVSSLITGWPPPSSPDLRLVFLAVGGVLAAVGGAIVVRARRAAARLRRLMAAGIELPAAVVEIRPSTIAVNRRRLWHVRYRYVHGVGAFTGESGALPEEAVAGLAAGDLVRVKVDLLRPADSVYLPRR